MGVVVFVMLHGFPPFYADPSMYGKAMSSTHPTRASARLRPHFLHGVDGVAGSYTDDRVYDLIRQGFKAEVMPGYGAYFPESMPISKEARDLISRLLDPDPKVCRPLPCPRCARC